MVTIEDDADARDASADGPIDDRGPLPVSTPLWILAAIGVAGLLAGGGLQIWSQRIGSGPDADAAQGLLAFLYIVSFGVVVFGGLALAIAVAVPLVRRYRDPLTTRPPDVDPHRPDGATADGADG